MSEKTYGAPLLAKDFNEHTKESFLAHVSALRRIPQNRVKASKPKKAKLAGKFLDQGTLSRPGAYEISFGEVKSTLAFALTRAKDENKTKVRTVRKEAFARTYAELKIREDLLLKFLGVKKFILDT